MMGKIVAYSLQMLLIIFTFTACQQSRNKIEIPDSLTKKEILDILNREDKNVKKIQGVPIGFAMQQKLSEAEMEEVMIEHQTQLEGSIYDSLFYAFNKVCEKRKANSIDPRLKKSSIEKFFSKGNPNLKDLQERSKIYTAFQPSLNEFAAAQKAIRSKLDDKIEAIDQPKITLLRKAYHNQIDFRISQQLKNSSLDEAILQSHYKRWTSQNRFQYNSVNGFIEPMLRHHYLLTEIAEELTKKYKDEIALTYKELIPLHKNFETQRKKVAARFGPQNSMVYKNDFGNELNFAREVCVLVMNSK